MNFDEFFERLEQNAPEFCCGVDAKNKARINDLEALNNAMLQELIECSYDLQCSCDHPACKPCERHGQLSEFIEWMKKAI